jgi:hypothetical protein
MSLDYAKKKNQYLLDTLLDYFLMCPVYRHFVRINSPSATLHWCSGTEVQRCSFDVVKGYKGAVVQRCSLAWYRGAVVQFWRGAGLQRYSEELPGECGQYSEPCVVMSPVKSPGLQL